MVVAVQSQLNETVKSEGGGLEATHEVVGGEQLPKDDNFRLLAVDHRDASVHLCDVDPQDVECLHCDASQKSCGGSYLGEG